MPMKSMQVATSGPIGAKRAAIPAAAPLTDLYKASIRRAAFEYVASGVVLREFVPVVGEVLRGASEQRAGLGAQGPLPGPQRGVGGGLPRRALRGCCAALPGADIQPRLDEQADEQGNGCRQVAVAEFGMGPREELLVEGLADDRYDVAVLGGSAWRPGGRARGRCVPGP